MPRPNWRLAGAGDRGMIWFGLGKIFDALDVSASKPTGRHYCYYCTAVSIPSSRGSRVISIMGCSGSSTIPQDLHNRTWVSFCCHRIGPRFSHITCCSISYS
jgi:hypothetical protein